MERRVKEWVRARKDRKKAEAAAADGGATDSGTAEKKEDAEGGVEAAEAGAEHKEVHAVGGGEKTAGVSDDEMNTSD
jgi:hypothetical protein